MKTTSPCFYKVLLSAALLSINLSLNGCTASPYANPDPVFSAHTGVYSVTDISYKRIMTRAHQYCPQGYQTIDIDHEDSFDWHIDIMCKPGKR
ncbi:hypothetical protein LMG33818_002568 [Halomonadaceae bacterium LMG 33818]|uniref:hypothetical protein n=1 Tax=Cernens ardua TaxID=3402176 RepID=UPI003EDCADE8